MNDVNELIDIIVSLGGSATLDDIVRSYQIKHKMLIHSNHKATIINTLSSNPSLVSFDINKGVWEVIFNDSINANDLFFGFDFKSKENIDNLNIVNDKVNEFMEKYTIESIKKLTLDEYAIDPNNLDNNSFCKLLKFDLKIVCSMGNCFNSTFEIYKNKDGMTHMSKTYSNEFGNDIEKAFSSLKDRICDFLYAAKNKDFEKMLSIKFNGILKRKLCSVYYRDIYFPSCVKPYIKNSCYCLGIEYNEQNAYVSMFELANWKYNYTDIKEADNYLIMSFANYLMKNGLVFNAKAIESSKTYWILSGNPLMYDSIKAFSDLKEIDWRQSYNYNIGDIVYIYLSKKTHRISIVTEVVKTNIRKGESIDDTKYWLSNENGNKDVNRFFRLKLIKFINDDRLSYDELKKHGLNVAPQVACKIKDDLLNYIESVVNEDNYD